MKKLIILSAILLAACAPVDNMTKRNTQGQPLEYKQGFSDGCGSGYVASGHPYARFKKDVSRFGSDELYKQGWGDGFSVCKGDYESTQRAMSRY